MRKKTWEKPDIQRLCFSKTAEASVGGVQFNETTTGAQLNVVFDANMSGGSYSATGYDTGSFS